MQNLFWGFVLIAFGIVLFLDNMGYADFTEIFENFWPLILIFFGFSILLKRNQSKHTAAPQSESQQGSVSMDLIHESNVFGDVVTVLSSQNFKGGSASTLFGDIRLDLSRIQIAEGTHELRVRGTFGSTTIIMPKNAGYAIFSTTVFGSQTILGQHKGGISTSQQTFSSTQATATNRLSIMVSQTFGDIRLEEAIH